MRTVMFLVFLLLLLPLPSAVLAGPLVITTGKVTEGYANTPLEFEIRGVPEAAMVVLESVATGKEVPCQLVERSSSGIRVAWLLDSLPKGKEHLWMVALTREEKATGTQRVEVKKSGSSGLAVKIDGKDFTKLLFAKSQQKPYFFPIIGPNGQMITRQYPMKKSVKGEDQDHPHHRSLWFDHGNVNGLDFWKEGPDKGRIRQVAVKAVESGAVFGKIVTLNEWLSPDGKRILNDRRVYTIYPLSRGEALLDIDITLTAAGEPVRFGDTKEGSLGIRIAETMKESRGGTILNSRGQKGMGQAWGKPAEWVDYHGPVAGNTVGVAILDHPKSFRHPTTWHARDYGLLAANPFGYHDFKYAGRNGDYTLTQGKALKFRYRLYFHHGTTKAARVADVYRGYASPPTLHPRT